MTIIDDRKPFDERRDRRLMLRLEQMSNAFYDGDPVTDIAGFADSVDDRVAALVVPGTNMTITYNDGAGTLTFDATGGGSVDWGDLTGIPGTFPPDVHTHILTGVTDVTITAANLNALDDGANTALHFHDADRARGAHTGTQLAATISDFSTAADARIGAASINALADVIITAPSTGQALKFNGTNWINDTDATGGGGGGATAISWVI